MLKGLWKYMKTIRLYLNQYFRIRPRIPSHFIVKIFPKVYYSGSLFCTWEIKIISECWKFFEKNLYHTSCRARRVGHKNRCQAPQKPPGALRRRSESHGISIFLAAPSGHTLCPRALNLCFLGRTLVNLLLATKKFWLEPKSDIVIVFAVRGYPCRSVLSQLLSYRFNVITVFRITSGFTVTSGWPEMSQTGY